MCHCSWSVSTEQGKGKSEVEANRQQDQAAKGHIHCLGSWELAGNWGATENVSVVSWADLSEGGRRRGEGWGQHFSYSGRLGLWVESEGGGSGGLLRRRLDQTEW